MNLYLISQDKLLDYDTYDEAVVAAETKEAARMMHPNGAPWDGRAAKWPTWPDVEHVKVRLLGVAVEGTEAGVICASFHAG